MKIDSSYQRRAKSKIHVSDNASAAKLTLFPLVIDLGSGVVASVAGGTDGVKTCSGIDHRPLSGFGHRSFVGR
jgi:hypothetical protein